MNARDNAQVARVSIGRLRAHPRNVRTDLGDLRDLAESIRQEGVLVPLMAERRGDYLRLLHGHRRWAAAQIAGLSRVPVVIVDPHDDDDAMLLMLAEDKKQAVRVDDKGRTVIELHEQFGYTWTGIADRLGVSEATVQSWVRAHRGHRAPRPSTKRRGDGRPKPPAIRPGAVHELINRYEAGVLTPAELVDELRGWLGGWQPRAATNQSVSSRVVDLVEREDNRFTTAAVLAARVGVSERHAVRARAILRSQRERAS